MELIYISANKKEFSSLEESIKELSLPVTIKKFETGTRFFYYLQSLPPSALPDAILIDSNPDTESEKGIVNEIKTDQRLLNILAIVYSPVDNDLDRKNCFALKADDYLIKAKTNEERKAILQKIYQLLLEEKSRRVKAV